MEPFSEQYPLYPTLQIEYFSSIIDQFSLDPVLGKKCSTVRTIGKCFVIYLDYIGEKGESADDKIN